MKCDVYCKYYHMCWNIGEGTCEIGEDCDQYKPEPPIVAFLCKDKGTEYCHHTKHIEQARNFEKVGPNQWMEKKPKRGEWTCNGNDLEYICSVCGEVLPYSDEYDYETDFCPNCGASMSANDEQVTGKLKEGDHE